MNKKSILLSFLSSNIYMYPLLCILFYSCSAGSKESSSCVDASDIVTLNPSDQWLKFPVDEDTEIGWYAQVIEKDGKEYVVIDNAGRPQLLFYDVEQQQCVRKITFHKEGPHGVGNVFRFWVESWDKVYLTSSHLLRLSCVNEKGEKQRDYRLEQDMDGNYLSACESFIATDSLFYLKLHHFNHNQKESRSHAVAVLNRKDGTIHQLPFYHPAEPTMEDLYHGRLGPGDAEVNWVYDGEHFVYSFGLQDSIYVASPDHSEIKAYNAKSRYLKPAGYQLKSPCEDASQFITRCNLLPYYDRIFYDPYREVYYRIAYPDTELDRKENQWDVWHYGRRCCSIVILDKDFHIIGETLLPDYRYQNRSVLILKDGLYICDSHYKRDDYDENVWSFQRFDLKKR